MSLLSNKIAQMEGKPQAEIKRVEEETRKGMVKSLKRFAIWVVIIIVLGILSMVALFLYALR